MKSSVAHENPLTLGVKSGCKDGKKGIYVALETYAASDAKKDCGVLVYDKESGECIGRHVLNRENRLGNVSYGFIEDVDSEKVSYLYFDGDSIYTDKTADVYMIEGKYGEKKAPDDYKAVRVTHEYDWENVSGPGLSYADSIMYCLHVRGFTQHESSGVIGKGTFVGIIEKLSYLKELGVTTLELQPCYEFDEADDVLNYWGYKEGYYYAPKRAYAFSDDPVNEFKDMVKACHRNGMEVILQFYFPDHVKRTKIPSILRHWAYHYQVDGFHLKGENLPLEELILDPYLAHIKLMHYDLPVDAVKTVVKPEQKRLALYDEWFMYTMRRLLKGDEGVINDAAFVMRRNPEKTGVVNYFSNYYGFTMMDMVSYNRKHNEDNGEENRDGTDFNFTWNCGEEGSTKKRNVLKLRNNQLYNAFVLLMLSQGTPMIFMGDEFGNSQSGNNNPYCQDNEITWLNWKDKTSNKKIFDFVKSLIAFRQKNKVFHQDKECLISDYLSCGFPQLSYHNQAAWMPRITEECRNIGFMLCGDYVKGNEGENWYVAINMHWESQEFALPRQPRGYAWEKMLTTERTEELLVYDDAGSRDRTVIVAPRSIAVFCGSK